MPFSAKSDNSKISGSTDRSFGLVFTIFFLIVSMLPLLHGHGIRVWAIILSSVFLALALIAPKLLAPLNVLWARFGMVLHRIASPIVLGVLFYGVFMPTGLLMRLVGKDLLRLHLDKNIDTYWIERLPSSLSPESLKLPF